MRVECAPPPPGPMILDTERARWNPTRTSSHAATNSLMFRATFRAMVKVGDRIPAVNLHEGFGPPKMVSLTDFCKGRKVVVCGLPGAFTPT